MLSPALLRVCCLAVMAPALTKAVRLTDGITLFLMPHPDLSFSSSKIEQFCINDHPTALNGPGRPPVRMAVGGTLSNGSLLSNGDLLHERTYDCNQSLENIRKITYDIKSTLFKSQNTKPLNNVNGHLNSVGVIAPTLEHSDFKNKMNEDITFNQERMGLLNANTSLDSDFQSKNFDQFVSSISPRTLPSESEIVKDIPSKCPVESLLSPLGSPKSISGESTSTITAHNHPVVTFVELEEARLSHHNIEVRAKELMLRLRKLQIIQTERHIVNQLKSLVSHYQKTLSIPCQRQVKQAVTKRTKDPVDTKAEFLQNEDVRNLSTAALVSLVRKLESSSPLGKPSFSNRNFLENESILNEKHDVRLEPRECEQVKQVTGSLLVRVDHLQSAIDSDVTESSSGGESCEELEGFDDKKTSSTPLHKRAVWTWAFERAPIAKRWTWLQSQVQDLEYRVRQIADLLAQARVAKGSTCFEEIILSETASMPSASDHSLAVKKALRSVNGFLDHTSNNDFHTVQSVPPSSELCLGNKSPEKSVTSSTDDCSSVSRTRPFKNSVFRKRKLLRTAGLHLMSRKAARLSTIRCNCNNRLDVTPCILCSGRYNNLQSVDPNVMPLLERVALLQPSFHPMLSFEKDTPISLHFENHLKTNETYYSVPDSELLPVKKPQLGFKPRGILDHARHHSRRLTKHAAQTLISSERYRNRHADSGSPSELRSSRSVVLKKWRHLKKDSLKNKRFRVWSTASSCSSRQDSPVHSPSALDDAMLLSGLPGKENSLHDIMKKRRDGHQFDIDNIVIPYNVKTASSFQKLQYKEIITPKWRYYDESMDNGPMDEENELIEDISEETVTKLHEKLEIEERKHLRGQLSRLSLAGTRRGRRNFRYDSRADSSGANTPDHLSYYHQDIMFQDSNSFISGGPVSPSLSDPPATPGSVNAMSDDSQPSSSHVSLPSGERKRTVSFGKQEKIDEGTYPQVREYIDHQPFERRTFPLSDNEWEEIQKESKQLESLPEPTEVEQSFRDPSSPGSLETSSSTSSAFEDDDDDIADPEWTVVRRQNGPERTLVIKLAKR